jgi:hypothetical protein
MPVEGVPKTQVGSVPSKKNKFAVKLYRTYHVVAYHGQRGFGKLIRQITCAYPGKIGRYTGSIQHFGKNAGHILAIAKAPAAYQTRIPGDKSSHAVLKCHIFYIVLYPRINCARFAFLCIQGGSERIHNAFQFGSGFNIYRLNKIMIKTVKVIGIGQIGSQGRRIKIVVLGAIEDVNK